MFLYLDLKEKPVKGMTTRFLSNDVTESINSQECSHNMENNSKSIWNVDKSENEMDPLETETIHKINNDTDFTAENIAFSDYPEDKIPPLPPKQNDEKQRICEMMGLQRLPERRQPIPHKANRKLTIDFMGDLNIPTSPTQGSFVRNYDLKPSLPLMEYADMMDNIPKTVQPIASFSETPNWSPNYETSSEDDEASINYSDSLNKDYEKEFDEQTPENEENEIQNNTMGRNLSGNVILAANAKVSKWEHVDIYTVLLGDHVRWGSEGIVTGIDRDKNTITVIWYRNIPPRIIEEIIINTKNTKVTKAIYTHQGYPAEIVVIRARSRFGEAKYNILTNNNSQFARWCKVGVGGKPPDISVPIQESRPQQRVKIEKFEELKEGHHIKILHNSVYIHAIIYQILGKKKHVVLAMYETISWPEGKLTGMSKIFGKGKLAEVTLVKMSWDVKVKRLVCFEETKSTQTDTLVEYATRQNVNHEEIEPRTKKDRIGLVSRSTQTVDSYDCKLSKTQSETTRVHTYYYEQFLDKHWIFTDIEDDYKEKVESVKPVSNPVYRMFYSGPVYPVEHIQSLVREHLGQIIYLVHYGSNSEEFPTFCCTGAGKFSQIATVAKGCGVAVLGSVSILCIKELLDLAIQSIPDEIYKAISSNVDKFVGATASIMPAAIVIPLLKCILIVVLKGIKIYKICKSYKEFEIDKKTRNIEIVTVVFETVAGISLMTLFGFLLGSFIPVPIIGNLIGVILGSLLGKVLGHAVKYCLFKIST